MMLKKNMEDASITAFSGPPHTYADFNCMPLSSAGLSSNDFADAKYRKYYVIFSFWKALTSKRTTNGNTRSGSADGRRGERAEPSEGEGDARSRTILALFSDIGGSGSGVGPIFFVEEPYAYAIRTGPAKAWAASSSASQAAASSSAAPQPSGAAASSSASQGLNIYVGKSVGHLCPCGKVAPTDGGSVQSLLKVMHVPERYWLFFRILAPRIISEYLLLTRNIFRYTRRFTFFVASKSSRKSANCGLGFIFLRP